MTNRATLMLPLLLILTLALPPAPSAHAGHRGHQGLQGGWAIDNGGGTDFLHSLNSQFPVMRQAGAGWVRINFRLGECFRDWTSRGCNGQTALEAYDRVVQEAGRHNLRIVGLFSNESWHGGQADWTANNAENNRGRNGDNAYIRAFAERAVRVVVRRYRSRIGHWEMWNEANAWTQLDERGNPTGGSFIYPSNFAWLLKRTHLEVRAAQPKGTVISGGIFGHDIGGQAVAALDAAGPRTVTRYGTLRGTRLERRVVESAGADADASARCGVVSSGADYLCSTYDAGRRHAGWDDYRRQRGTYPLDQIGQHLYIDQGSPTSARKLQTYLREMRAAASRYGDGNKQLAMTEFGWQTAYVDAATQARNLRTAYETFRRVGYVSRAFWFGAQDIPEGNLYYGLVDGDGRRKPAFNAFHTFATY